MDLSALWTTPTEQPKLCPKNTGFKISNNTATCAACEQSNCTCGRVETCLMCNSGYKLSDGECVQSCPNNQVEYQWLDTVCSNDRYFNTNEQAQSIPFKSKNTLSLAAWTINFWFMSEETQNPQDPVKKTGLFNITINSTIIFEL